MRRITVILTVLVACYSNDYAHCSDETCVQQPQCTAQSCLDCQTVDADCQLNNETNILHCRPVDRAQCNLTACRECETCVSFLRRTDQVWKLLSKCTSFERIDVCDKGDITDRCIVSENVTDASEIVTQFEGDAHLLYDVCYCVEENCTEEFVVNFFVVPELTPSPSETTIPSDDNECTDSNGGCEHQCTNLDGGYECSCNEGFVLNSDGKSCSGSSSRSYSAVIGVLCGLVAGGIIITLVTMIWIVRRRKHSGLCGVEHSLPVTVTVNEADVLTTN